jgi:hypothetical protein
VHNPAYGRAIPWEAVAVRTALLQGLSGTGARWEPSAVRNTQGCEHNRSLGRLEHEEPNSCRTGAIRPVCFVGAGSGQVQAVEYPWCRIEGGGSRGCYYANKEQCAAQGRGFGGTCIENPFYPKPVERPPLSGLTSKDRHVADISASVGGLIGHPPTSDNSILSDIPITRHLGRFGPEKAGKSAATC